MTLDYIDNLEDENKILRGNTDLVNLELIEYKNDLEDRIDKAIEEIKIILEMAKDYEEVNLVDRLEIILKTLRGKDNEL